MRNDLARRRIALLAQEFSRCDEVTEAVRLVVKYYFEELRYQKVTVYLMSFNTPSAGLFEKLGFQAEGRLRRVIYTAGQYYDFLVYGMTDDEFAVQHADSLPDTFADA